MRRRPVGQDSGGRLVRSLSRRHARTKPCRLAGAPITRGSPTRCTPALDDLVCADSAVQPGSRRVSIGRLWSPALLRVGRGHVPPPTPSLTVHVSRCTSSVCQCAHLSTPGRSVHLLNPRSTRMLGGHGVEPGAPLVECVAPLRLPLLAPRLLLPRVERRTLLLLLLLLLRRTLCCHTGRRARWGGGKKAAAAPCAVGGGTNGDAPESAPMSSAGITPSTAPVRTSRNDGSADAADLGVDPRRWVRQSGLVTPALVGAPREPMRAECGARHR